MMSQDLRNCSTLHTQALTGCKKVLLWGMTCFPRKEIAIISLIMTMRTEINCLRILDILNTKGKRKVQGS